jgi:lysylphosphatidylglycerol synthetase-like protein (DUF2156 family)
MRVAQSAGNTARNADHQAAVVEFEKSTWHGLKEHPMKKPSPKKRQRPFGINAIIVLLVLLVLNNGVDVIRSIAGLPPHTFPDVNTLIIQALNAVIAILYAVLAVGLWQMRDWAWYAAMIASGLSMFFSIWRHFYGGQPYVTMFLVVVMVFYLNQREVKAAFQRVREAEAKP